MTTQILVSVLLLALLGLFIKLMLAWEDRQLARRSEPEASTAGRDHPTPDVPD